MLCQSLGFREHVYHCSKMANSSFREYVPDSGVHPRLGKINFEEYDAYSWVEFGKRTGLVGALLDGWNKLDAVPVRGVTTNGELERDLFCLRNESAPVHAMAEAANKLMAEAETAQVSEKLRYPLDTDKWRCWGNPEFYFAQHGLRFEEHSETLRTAALNLVKTSLSQKGYDEMLGIMRINGFLGGLVGATRLMNERSYNFILFGEPSVSTPWGWSLWGHHLACCVLVLGGQIVVSPVFRGCEPNYIDTDEFFGQGWFEDEMHMAVDVMGLLNEEERRAVTVYDSMDHPDMPQGLPHPADGRVMTGAHQDNAILPYKGGKVSTFSKQAQQAVLHLVEAFIGYLPKGPLECKMDDVNRYLDRTWLAWIGGYGEKDVFYFRVHSPVIICEFDHECGMYLTNDNPGRFHVHTVVRTPNGNDYGRELIRLWKEQQ